MVNAPHGYLQLTPYFTLNDADKFIAFAVNVFGASIIKESRYENGVVQHVRLQIFDSLIMLNQATDEYSPNVSQMHLYVDDAEKTYRRALEYGASSLMKPMIRPHGDRMAGFKDPAGNIWWVATGQ